MPYLETVQELLDDGTPLSTNLALSWNELRTNLRVTCGKLATNLLAACDALMMILAAELSAGQLAWNA